AADTLLQLAEIEVEEIRPVADAMERGGRLAAKEQVTDSILDRCKPIAGTPADCIEAIEEYRDAGCTHVMLELWGAKRHEQIRLFAEKVLPQFRSCRRSPRSRRSGRRGVRRTSRGSWPTYAFPGTSPRGGRSTSSSAAGIESTTISRSPRRTAGSTSSWLPSAGSRSS